MMMADCLFQSSFFIIAFLFFSYFMGWGGLIQIFVTVILMVWFCWNFGLGFDTHGQRICFSFWLLAEGLFVIFVIILMIMLLCTFSRINLSSFYLFLRAVLFLLFPLFQVGDINQSVLKLVFTSFFYTMLASLPIVVGILCIYSVFSTFFIIIIIWWVFFMISHVIA